MPRGTGLGVLDRILGPRGTGLGVLERSKSQKSEHKNVMYQRENTKKDIKNNVSPLVYALLGEFLGNCARFCPKIDVFRGGIVRFLPRKLTFLGVLD